MTDTAHLAALLHEAIRDAEWVACVHSPEGEWLPYCEDAAARLIAAGVTLAPVPSGITPPDALRVALENLARHHELERVHGNTHIHPDKCEFVMGADRALAAPTPPDALPDRWHRVHKPQDPECPYIVCKCPTPPDALPFAETQRFYNAGYAAGVRASTKDDDGKTCPKCGHPHLPMPGPWRTSSGLRINPVCDWPMGAGESCTCHRRTVGKRREQSAPTSPDAPEPLDVEDPVTGEKWNGAAFDAGFRWGIQHERETHFCASNAKETP